MASPVLLPKPVTRRTVLAAAPAAIAAAVIAMPILPAAGAEDDVAVHLWRRYRANQVELFALFRQQWPASDVGDYRRVAELQARAQPFEDADAAFVRAIEALDTASPAAVAAKLNLAFDHSDKEEFLADLPWCTLGTMVRCLLPHLPADMIAALAPLTKGPGTDTKIWQALGAGGSPAHIDDVRLAGEEA